jgi:hypothetical protein
VWWSTHIRPHVCCWRCWNRDYSDLRPGEAVNLRKQDLAIPETGWGELLLWESASETDASWSETGARPDKR